MAKEEELDQLTKDAIAARKAGMSYGKYKAMQQPVTITPKLPKGGVRHVCQHCGKEFVRYDRKVCKFCSDECREKFYYKQRKASVNAHV